MKKLAWIAALLAVTGCVHMPVAKDKPSKSAKTTASQKPASQPVLAVTADEVTPENAHRVADQLLSEMERKPR